MRRLRKHFAIKAQGAPRRKQKVLLLRKQTGAEQLQGKSAIDNIARKTVPSSKYDTSQKSTAHRGALSKKATM